MHRVAFGFAAAVFAAMLPAAANAATAVTTSNVNLRQGPSTDYPIITTLPGNTAVEIEGCAQGWCKVDYAGAAGWMSEDFLQGLSSPPAIVLPVPVIVPGRHHHLRPPIYRPPVVRPPVVRPPVVGPRPPHHRPPGIHPPRPMPPGIHPPRPPHHRPPGGGRPPGGRPPGGPGAGPKPPGIHPPPQHRPPGGGHRPPGGGGGRPRPGTQG